VAHYESSSTQVTGDHGDERSFTRAWIGLFSNVSFGRDYVHRCISVFTSMYVVLNLVDALHLVGPLELVAVEQR
jgi:hypothetical protein